MNKNRLYTVLWTLIIITSAPAMAMDMLAPMDTDTTASVMSGKRSVKRPAPDSDDEKESSAKKRKTAGKFICAEPKCDKICPSYRALMSHLKIHVEKRLKCTNCPRTFAHKKSLTRHIRDNHTDKASHTCELCGDDFDKKDALTTHMRTHTDKTIFICNVCKQGFNRKRDLTRHLQSKAHAAKAAHFQPTPIQATSSEQGSTPAVDTHEYSLLPSHASGSRLSESQLEEYKKAQEFADNVLN